MKKVVVILLAFVLGFGGYVGYHTYQTRKAEAEIRAMEFAFVRAEFGAYVAMLQEAVGEKGAAKLKKLADEFPRTDTGIGYEGFGVRTEDDTTIYAPRVEFVWMDSAAHHAGVQPGDWVFAIDGTSVEMRCPKDASPGCPSTELAASIRSVVDAAEKKKSLFTLSRDGVTRKSTLTPVPYGQDIHDYILGLDAYIKQLDAVAPKVAALAKKVEKMDEKSIGPLSEEANALLVEIQAPYRDLEAYMKTRVILPPRATEARPQL